MSEQSSAKLVRTFFDNISAHDLSSNDVLKGDGYVFEGPGLTGQVNSEGQRYIQNFVNAFPDLHFDVTLTVTQGDYVVAHWTASGTHDAPLMSPSGNAIPPTHNRATTLGSSTFEIKNGKVIHGWTFWDMATFLTQLRHAPHVAAACCVGKGFSTTAATASQSHGMVGPGLITSLAWRRVCRPRRGTTPGVTIPSVIR